MTKDIDMNVSSRNHIISAFAAIICAFITIGISIAPAVAPAAGLVA